MLVGKVNGCGIERVGVIRHDGEETGFGGVTVAALNK